jgi:hypothetical protein
MLVELEMTQEQVDKLHAFMLNEPGFESVIWQLSGYWIAGGDEPAANKAAPPVAEQLPPSETGWDVS